MELVQEKYKITDIGLIPEEWELKTIGEIFTFYATANYSKAEMVIEGEVGCVHYGLIHAIENTSYSVASGIKYYVNNEQAKYEKLQNGDVVMVDASEDLIGLNKSVEVSGINNKQYISGLHTFHLRDKNSIYVDSYRGLILNSDAVKRQMLRFAVGMKVFGVSKPQLRQIIIPVPPKSEQTAIATALSDMDALISSLEKLIEKKRMIKQGAMQELLKPKDGWVVKRLGDILTFGNGKDYKHLNSGEIPVYGTGGVLTFVDEYIYEGESVGIGRKGTIDKPIFLTGKFWSVDTLFFTYKFNNAIPKFVYYMFCMIRWIEYNEASGVPSLNKKTLENIEIPTPSLDEQIHIANILSDMDSEIAALELKMDKNRRVKYGMMQNLLTGKIRLLD